MNSAPLRHFKDPRFQPFYDTLPADVQKLADKSFALLKGDPKHPSLHFKRVKGRVWSARVGIKYRAVALEAQDGFQWFWIGAHTEYERLLRD